MSLPRTSRDPAISTAESVLAVTSRDRVISPLLKLINPVETLLTTETEPETIMEESSWSDDNAVKSPSTVSVEKS